MNTGSGEVCTFLRIVRQKKSLSVNRDHPCRIPDHCLFCQFPFDYAQDMPSGTSLNTLLLLEA